MQSLTLLSSKHNLLSELPIPLAYYEMINVVSSTDFELIEANKHFASFFAPISTAPTALKRLSALLPTEGVNLCIDALRQQTTKQQTLKFENEKNTNLKVVPAENGCIWVMLENVTSSESSVSEQYLSIISSMSDMVFLMDMNGVFLNFHQAVSPDLFALPSEFVGKSIMEIGLPDEIVQQFMQAASRLRHGESLISIEYELFINEKRNWYDARLSRYLTPENTFAGVVAVVRNINAYKKTEEDFENLSALQHILMNLATRFVNIPLNVVDKAITEALADIGTYAGVDISYLFTYDWSTKTCCNTHEWCAKGIKPEINNLKSVPLELLPDWVQAHQSGEIIYVPSTQSLSPDSVLYQILEPQGIQSLIALPLMKDKEAVGFIGFDAVRGERTWREIEITLLTVFAEMLTNVRTHMQYESDLVKAKEKAQESDRLKSAFLANMSHEIRTPMNHILGFINMLNDADLTEEERGEYIEIVNTSGHHLLQLINDILDIAKIEAGQMVLRKEKFNLHALLHELHASFKINPDLLEKGQVNLYLENSVLLEKNITSDAGRIKQVLTNLLSNAIKFTHRGSISFGYQQDNEGTLTFFVKDTGIGVLPEARDKIFERFKQADDSDTRQYGGTGLGLSISKGLIELLGGRIYFESEVGKGSTFYFTIPNVVAKKTPIVNPSVAGEKQHTILVAEDDDFNFRLLRQMIKSLNFNILRAVNGIDAVQLAATHPEIELILMDIKMPHMDGYEATRLIKAERPNLPIIAQTAHAMSGDKERTMEAGCNDYISKPLNKQTLFALIAKYIQI